MATLLVGYALHKPVHEYARLFETLKSHGTWWHGLDSTWFIKTDLTAAQLRDALMALIDSNDALLVLDVSDDPAAWVGFPQPAGDWLKANL